MKLFRHSFTFLITHITKEISRESKKFLVPVAFIILPVAGYGQLTVDFLASSTSVCSGTNVTFTNNSTEVSDTATFKWDFGAGATPSTADGIGPHTVSYSGSGRSSVSLTVTDTVTITKTKPDYINIIVIPAIPIVEVTDNCDTTSTLSTTADGFLLWSNGEMSSSIVVSTPGVYTVTTTINGCSSLPGSGTATPGISPPFPVQMVDCSLGLTRAVINISEPLGPEYEYRLDAGAFQSEPTFSRVANGSHRITVRIASGCTTSGEYFEVSCDCTDPATVTLSSTSGNTCSKTPITISGNSFGGAADFVTITENGKGSVSPSLILSSPFEFTYTPKADDEGNIVIITVTTNNPLGTPCVAAKETYSLTVNPVPEAPLIKKISQPTCLLQSASVEFDGLPASGTWTLSSSPGDITAVGNGVSTTVSNIPQGTYRFTVISEAGCISDPSAEVVILSQPVTPSPPEIGAVIQPTCTKSTGSVTLNGLPATGNWILTRNPGGLIISGSGTSKLVTDLPTGAYTFTLLSSSGCTSASSSAVIINSQPLNPAPPSVGTISPPTCILSTGTVNLTGLPETGSWSLTRYPGIVVIPGSGTSALVSGLSPGMYNFTISDVNGCLSVPSANVIIPAQPPVPTAPITGAITLPTCIVPTGSVVLSGLPASGSWIISRSSDATVIPGTGTSIAITGLSSGTYYFFVTNSSGCVSPLSNEVIIPLQPGIPSLIITNPSAVCSNSTADLTLATITAGSTPGLTLSYWNNQTGTTPHLTPGASPQGTYYIKGTTNAGCFDIKPVIVTGLQLPIAYAGPDQILEFQSGTTLDADLTNASETGIWSIISGTAVFSDITLPKTSVSGLSQGVNEFLWTVTNRVCPPASDTVRIIVNELKIRTLLTPNMDGRNDYFIVNGLNVLGRTQLEIYDRRGVQVYKNPDYDNLWNGVNYNDDPLPDDTYFFVIIPEIGKSFSGFFVIRR